MKPLKLFFRGINSFSDPVEIDFEQVTKNGIFGIFGDTGSGKSTILDSINFALYGDIDRSKKKTDIINYNCDSAEVKFSFVMLAGGARKTYTVERNIRKKSGLIKAMLYAEDENGALCIADNTSSVTEKIEEIIGLKDEDFRKCIALPQGEFAQFVSSAPSDRLKLIERLFSLSKYGERLKERLSEREYNINCEYNAAEGELSAYSDISEGKIKVLEINLKENTDSLSKLNRENEKAKQEYSNLSRLFENKRELEKTKRQLEELLSSGKEMEALRRSLKVLPECKAVFDSSKELALKKNKLNKLSGEKQEKMLLIAKLDGEIAVLSRKIADCEYDKKIMNEQKLLASYNACAGLFEEYESAKTKLSDLRAKYSALLNDGKKLSENETRLKEKAQATQKAYDDCSKADIKDFFDNRFKHSVLREEYKKQIVYFGDLRESIKGYDDGSDLYAFVREELTERIRYYENLILASVGVEIDIEETIKELQAATDKRERLAKQLNASMVAYQESANAVKVNAGECEYVRREGEQTASRVKDINEKLADVFGESVSDYKSAAKAAESKITALSKAAEDDKNSLENMKKLREEANLRLAELSTLIATTEEEIKNLDKTLNKSLSDSGFSRVEDCVNLIERFEDASNAETELKKYDEKIISLTSMRDKLEKIEGIDKIDADALKASENNCLLIEKQIRDLHGEIKVAQSGISELNAKLQKKKEIENNFKRIAEQKNLISQLKELTKNNKFLEYIASEYLSEISSLASVTLLKLTDGRYFLKYADTFYVGDNFNEGNLRGVNTLSGGETFLVSLSLALALSSVICAKSLNSIEFFFLDEGFGTLDENLIDTVMNSLEKLKSSEFTIGIISHVEELKHRIESKILVSKATESRGSSIRIIC